MKCQSNPTRQTDVKKVVLKLAPKEARLQTFLCQGKGKNKKSTLFDKMLNRNGRVWLLLKRYNTCC